jgi:hypothetical protein
VSARAAPSDSRALFGLDGQIADFRVGSTNTTSESSGTPRLRCTRTTAGDGFTGRGRRRTQQSGRTLPVCRAAGSLGTRPNTSPGWTPCAPKQEPPTMFLPRVKRSRACAVSMDNQYTDDNLQWSCGTKILSMSNPAVYCTRLIYIRSYSYHAYNAMHNFVITSKLKLGAWLLA